MSIKQWYQALLEDRVLMNPPTDTSPQSLIPVRVEILSPTIDWPQTWKLVRSKGLDSDLVSFLFKLLHCPHNMVPGNGLLGFVQVAAPGLTQEGALKLLLETDMAEDEILASLYVLSAGLRFIYGKREL